MKNYVTVSVGSKSAEPYRKLALFVITLSQIIYFTLFVITLSQIIYFTLLVITLSLIIYFTLFVITLSQVIYFKYVIFFRIFFVVIFPILSLNPNYSKSIFFWAQKAGENGRLASKSGSINCRFLLVFYRYFLYYRNIVMITYTFVCLYFRLNGFLGRSSWF